MTNSISERCDTIAERLELVLAAIKNPDSEVVLDLDEAAEIAALLREAAAVAKLPDRLAARFADDPLALLVGGFAVDLLRKLEVAAEKRGLQHHPWRSPDWADDLRAQLRAHVEKGDPLDVAAYCSFAWHHGWSLAPAAPPQDRTKAPEDWVLIDRGEMPAEEVASRWHANLDAVSPDGRHKVKHAWGSSKEEAIAAAWREVDRLDLEALAASMCSTEPHGLLLLHADRSRPEGGEPSWQVSINTAFGVHLGAIKNIEMAYANSDFDIGDALPKDGTIDFCIVLCRVVYESADYGDYGRVTCPESFGVEVVKVGERLAIEVYP